MLSEHLAGNIGKSLQRCSDLQKITLCTGDGSASKQVLEFQDIHLHLESISEDLINVFLELNHLLLVKVCCHISGRPLGAEGATPLKKNEAVRSNPWTF